MSHVENEVSALETFLVDRDLGSCECQKSWSVLTDDAGQNDLVRISVQNLKAFAMEFTAMPGKFSGIYKSVKILVSDSKSNRLHVDVFPVLLLYSFELYYSIDSSKMISNSP